MRTGEEGRASNARCTTDKEKHTTKQEAFLYCCDLDSTCGRLVSQQGDCLGFYCSKLPDQTDAAVHKRIRSSPLGKTRRKASASLRSARGTVADRRRGDDDVGALTLGSAPTPQQPLLTPCPRINASRSRSPHARCGALLGSRGALCASNVHPGGCAGRHGVPRLDMPSEGRPECTRGGWLALLNDRAAINACGDENSTLASIFLTARAFARRIRRRWTVPLTR